MLTLVLYFAILCLSGDWLAKFYVIVRRYLVFLVHIDVTL